MDEAYKKPEPMPLFDERARKTDPATSHKRAKELSRSPRLTRIMLAVLKTIRLNPGLTAHSLGRIMYKESGIIEMTTWPHKTMSRLEDAGYVWRTNIEGKKGLHCHITIAGRIILKKQGK